MQTASVILQSVEGTQTELQMDAGKNLQPVLLNSSLCANVVLKVRSAQDSARKSFTMRQYFSIFLDQSSLSFITVNIDCKDEYKFMMLFLSL